MEILRTPDERFDNLPDYPFAPHYIEVDGIRIHYLDEGPADAAPVLLMHGEPSWSFLYRKMVPILTAAGHRVIAPDLVGFGRSDKPAAREDYTYQRHVDWMTGLLTGLALRDVTLFGQDWGGLIGLRLAAENEERFARIIAANTFLTTGDIPPGRAFLRWQQLSQETPDFRAGEIVKGGCTSELPDAVVTAYDAPFPDERYLAGARQFPMIVPISPDDPAAPANRAAWEVLRRWQKPFLCTFSDRDPITRSGARYFQEAVPGAQGQPHTTISGAGHFLQEDRGEDLAQVIVGFLAR
ncbi:MAG TPA: haloalkane dehalogenase [Ktedonobacterales bacterium]|nr:haloalkane dehalogenase [Ktedonobacterales bacterium]